MAEAGADTAACPGKRGPIRPTVALSMCRRCAQFDPIAPGRAPATHNGAKWICPKFTPRPDSRPS